MAYDLMDGSSFSVSGAPSTEGEYNSDMVTQDRGLMKRKKYFDPTRMFQEGPEAAMPMSMGMDVSMPGRSKEISFDPSYNPNESNMTRTNDAAGNTATTMGTSGSQGGATPNYSGMQTPAQVDYRRGLQQSEEDNRVYGRMREDLESLQRNRAQLQNTGTFYNASTGTEEDTRPSVGRKILGTLAGIGMGIMSRNPMLAYETGRDIIGAKKESADKDMAIQIADKENLMKAQYEKSGLSDQLMRNMNAHEQTENELDKPYFVQGPNGTFGITERGIQQQQQGQKPQGMSTSGIVANNPTADQSRPVNTTVQPLPLGLGMPTSMSPSDNYPQGMANPQGVAPPGQRPNLVQPPAPPPGTFATIPTGGPKGSPVTVWPKKGQEQNINEPDTDIGAQAIETPQGKFLQQTPEGDIDITGAVGKAARTQEEKGPATPTVIRATEGSAPTGMRYGRSTFSWNATQGEAGQLTNDETGALAPAKVTKQFVSELNAWYAAEANKKQTEKDKESAITEREKGLEASRQAFQIAQQKRTQDFDEKMEKIRQNDPKVPQETLTKSSGANQALGLVTEIERVAKENPRIFGVVMGRINETGNLVGSDFGLNDPSDSKAAMYIQGLMVDLFAADYKMNTGASRPNKEIIDAFKSKDPSLHLSPGKLEGSIDAIKKTANITMNNAATFRTDFKARQEALGIDSRTGEKKRSFAENKAGHRIYTDDGGKTWFDAQTNKPVK